MKKTIAGTCWAFFILFVFILFFYDLAYQNQGCAIEPVSITGSFQVDNGPEGSLENLNFSKTGTRHSIVIRGHFSKAVPQGEELQFYVQGLFTAIRVNGKLVYETDAKKDSFMGFSAYGAMWESFLSDGILEKDSIEIEIKDIKLTIAYPAVTKLLNSFCIGSRSDLLWEMFHERGTSFCIAFTFLVFGILLLNMAIMLWATCTLDTKRLFFLACFILSCSMWFAVREPMQVLMMERPVCIYLLDVFCQYFITISALAFTKSFLTGYRRRAIGICEEITLVFVSMVTGIQFFTETDFYDFMPIGASFNALFLMITILCAGYEAVVFHYKAAKQLLLSMIPILVGGLAEIGNYIFLDASLPIGIAFFIGFSLFILMQMVLFVYSLRENLEIAAKKDQELLQNRISIMLSQIQPHFLYNALEAVRELCITDPIRAEQAVTEFSLFLRGNMDALTGTEPIPFCQELIHTKYYLELEKLRFGERLHVVLELSADNFYLPCLTLQPIVENAVRHGVTQKKAGGTVTISSAETEKAFIVKVMDDGIGFSAKNQKADGRTHIGFSNVQERLRVQCGGSITVESVLKQGTIVTISIPKEHKV